MIDYFFEEFDHELLYGRARVANPMSRNILEKCGFQWTGVELHRFEALGSSSPVDLRFRSSRSARVVAEATGRARQGGERCGNFHPPLRGAWRAVIAARTSAGWG